MTPRLEVAKTYKLFIGGQFPRSESGRSLPVENGRRVLAHCCLASRKDLRDAVAAARAAQEGWQRRSAYNRGQVMYRLAEILEGKKDEFVEAVAAVRTGSERRVAAGRIRSLTVAARKEVEAAIDRLVAYAGWADKFQQVLGCNNPVAGPFYNYSAPEASGVVAVVAPDDRPLLALVSLLAPPLCAGNAIVAVASETNPIPACVFGEVCATSDVPAGVVNILTGRRAELVPYVAGHRDIDSIHAANLPEDQARALREGSAENVKRVTVRTLADEDWFDPRVCATPWWIERFVEIKTIWHPAGA